MRLLPLAALRRDREQLDLRRQKSVNDFTHYFKIYDSPDQDFYIYLIRALYHA